MIGNLGDHSSIDYLMAIIHWLNEKWQLSVLSGPVTSYEVSCFSPLSVGTIIKSYKGLLVQGK